MFKVIADVVYTFLDEEIANKFACKYSIKFNTLVVINYPNSTHINYKNGVKSFK